MRKGKEKATAEIGLSFLTYNMRRAINILGVTRLLEELRSYPQGASTRTCENEG